MHACLNSSGPSPFQNVFCTVTLLYQFAVVNVFRRR
jgi:hypothetical protein